MNKEKWLNNFGLLLFTNKNNPELTLRRAYYWIDRALILKGNEVIKDLRFSEVDLNEWVNKNNY